MEKEPLINKLLENQYLVMFENFDSDRLESLTLEQFRRYVFAIGMEFIVKHFDSGRGELFNTPTNPSKDRVTFFEFMNYLTVKTTFESTPLKYR